MTIADGFPGQKLIVVPRPLVDSALSRPSTSHLLVTDCGYFPEARAHGMIRPIGLDQAVVIVCARGRGWCDIEGVRHRVARGQVLVIPPGIPHSYGAEPDDPWTLWWLHVGGTDLHDLLRSSRLTAPAPVREVSDLFRIVALVEEVIRSMEHDSTPGSLLAASGAAWHLMAVLATDSTAPGRSVSTLERARDYLRDHLTDRVSVAQLAGMASMSPSHFSALFRQSFGVAVLQYQTQLRMARARELLDTTDRSVAAIAAAVGYADPFYFSRHFTVIHGVTPRRYRGEHKG